MITRRETKGRIYSIVIYYIAKTLAEVLLSHNYTLLCIFNSSWWLFKLPQNIIFPIVTTTITFWLANIHPSFWVYIKMIAIITLTANASVGFGKFSLWIMIKSLSRLHQRSRFNRKKTIQRFNSWIILIMRKNCFFSEYYLFNFIKGLLNQIE